ncbi:MAG: hypothetical protein P8Z36_06160 [Gemmatimonadota bacterium]
MQKPREAWWERDDLWRWEWFRASYRYRRTATLEVRDRSWAAT